MLINRNTVRGLHVHNKIGKRDEGNLQELRKGLDK